MQKIGFFGGSFNPPTNAHLTLALKVIEKFNLDKVIFVPMNKHYPKEDLIEEEHRLNMLRIMCEENNKLEVWDIEFKINKKVYAVDIFEIISNLHKEDEVYYIMGSDNYKNLSKWKSNEKLQNYKYIVLLRDEDTIKKQDNIFLLEDSKISISSTIIRENIKNNIEITDFLPKKIEKYIYKNNLYK